MTESQALIGIVFVAYMALGSCLASTRVDESWLARFRNPLRTVFRLMWATWAPIICLFEWYHILVYSKHKD